MPRSRDLLNYAKRRKAIGYATIAQREACHNCQSVTVSAGESSAKRYYCRRLGSAPVSASAICWLYVRRSK